MGRATFASSLVTPSDPLARLVDADVDTSRVVLHVGGLAAAYLRLVKKRAITFRGHIWFRDEAARGDRVLVVHELVHVGQYRRMGTPRFLLHYLRDLARARFRYSHDLPLEAPAYARQAERRRCWRTHRHPSRDDGWCGYGRTSGSTASHAHAAIVSGG